MLRSLLVTRDDIDVKGGALNLVLRYHELGGDFRWQRDHDVDGRVRLSFVQVVHRLRRAGHLEHVAVQRHPAKQGVDRDAGRPFKFVKRCRDDRFGQRLAHPPASEGRAQRCEGDALGRLEVDLEGRRLRATRELAREACRGNAQILREVA